MLDVHLPAVLCEIAFVHTLRHPQENLHKAEELTLEEVSKKRAPVGPKRRNSLALTLVPRIDISPPVQDDFGIGVCTKHLHRKPGGREICDSAAVSNYPIKCLASEDTWVTVLGAVLSEPEADPLKSRADVFPEQFVAMVDLAIPNFIERTS